MMNIPSSSFTEVVASAPGKTILFGEHAVVYGEPGIAIPVPTLQAHVTIRSGNPSTPTTVSAPAVGLSSCDTAQPESEPIRALLELLSARYGLPLMTGHTIRVDSDLPVAAGLGSGAAVSVALIRAVNVAYALKLSDQTVSDLAFEIEKIHHGTPSGIDNSVIAFNRPILFVKGEEIRTIQPRTHLPVLIADTNIRASTAIVVGDVRKGYPANAPLIRAIGDISRAAVRAIETGDLPIIGALMNANQTLLREINVSCQEIDELVAAALQAGALGAKLTGAGRGGNVIALLPDENPETIANVRNAFQQAGATIR